MAEAFEAEIKIKGAEEAARDLRNLEGSLEGVADGMGTAANKSGNFSADLTAAVVTAQAAFGALVKLKDTIGAVADEFERQSGILNRFNGNISEAARRTNGLISNIDLMAASSRAANAGLTLTGSQLATLSVRASETAASVGGDATEALNGLIQAVLTGGEELQQYGVRVDDVTNLTDKQSAAVARLTNGYEDAESSADTLGGRLQVLETRLENMQTEMTGVLNDSGLLESAFDSLGDAAHTLIGEIAIFGESDGPLSQLELFTLTGAAMFSAFATQVEASATVVRSAIEIISDPTNLAAIQRASDALDSIGFDAFDRQVTEGQRAGLESLINTRNARTREGIDRAAAAAPSGGGRGGGGGARAADEATNTTKAKEELLALIAQQEAAEQRLLENGASKAEVAAQLAKAEQERLDLLRLQSAEGEKQKMMAMEALDAERERQSTMRRATRAQQGVTEGLENIASITKRTIALNEEGGMTMKQAFVTALDEQLKAFAISEAWKGAGATVEAIGAAIMNPPHAAAKVAEAAGHFALAAAAGGASAAIPNAGGGGGAGGGATRPEANPQAGGGGGGGNVVINYNAPTAESQLGLMQGRANRAAQKRFGS